MKKRLAQILGLIMVIVTVGVFLLFVTGKASATEFWITMGIAAVFAYIGLPQLTQHLTA